MHNPQIIDGCIICPKCRRNHGTYHNSHPIVEFRCICGFGKEHVRSGVWIYCNNKKHLLRQPGTNYLSDGQIWHVPLLKGTWCSNCMKNGTGSSKRLVSITNTKGKSDEQVANEVMASFKKYQQVYEESVDKLEQEILPNIKVDPDSL